METTAAVQTLTDELLGEIENEASMATSGRWEALDSPVGELYVSGSCDEFICGAIDHVHDANLIAHMSPDNVISLITELRTLRAQVKALQSDANSWQSGYDEGRRMAGKHRLSEVDQLRAETERLQRFENAFNEWHDKTEWVQTESSSLSAKYLGCHRADVMRDLIESLRAENARMEARLEELSTPYSRTCERMWALEAENAELRLDAGRYRWLRMTDWWDGPLSVVVDAKKNAKPGTDCPSRGRLDTAIDTAMEQAK